MAPFVIASVDEVSAQDSVARQAARRAARQTDVVQEVLRHFLVTGGPVPVADVIAAFDGRRRAGIAETLTILDTEDIIRIQGDSIDLAYPFSAAPTPFVVGLPQGGARYACCAIDALGVAPMIGASVEVTSRCHHCEGPLVFPVAPEGPGRIAEGTMLWVGKRVDDRCRATDSL